MSQIKIDPFFDGQGSMRRNGPLHGVEIVDQDYNTYQDASINPSLRRGPGGLKGVVIPSASRDGWTPAFDPHHPSGIQVHVDPDIGGQSVVLDVSEISPEAMQRAIRATENVPEELRRSAPYHYIAQQRQQMADKTANVNNQPGVTGSLRNVLRTAGTQPAPQPTAAPAEATVPLISEPGIKVTFEIEHFGELIAFYHRVIWPLSNDKLILVSDTRYRGHVYMPENISGRLGVYVEGDTMAHVARCSGLRFQDGNSDYCVLQIEQSIPYTPAAGGRYEIPRFGVS